jgi:hypothetical protein
MATLPTPEKIGIGSLCRTARRQAITNGIVEASSSEQRRYWNHWRQFCRSTNPPLDPMSHHKDTNKTVDALEFYTAWIWSGKAGQGARVGAQTVQVALCAIGKKCELDRQPNPIYRPNANKEYWKSLARMIESYRCQDPPPRPKLAVPVEVATTAAKVAIMTTKPHQEGDHHSSTRNERKVITEYIPGCCWL